MRGGQMSKPKSPWQPIETAPKNCKFVIVGWASGPMRGKALAQINNGGFYEFNSVNDDGEFHVRPTHWMPIPPLPEGER